MELDPSEYVAFMAQAAAEGMNRMQFLRMAIQVADQAQVPPKILPTPVDVPVILDAKSRHHLAAIQASHSYETQKELLRELVLQATKHTKVHTESPTVLRRLIRQF